MALMEIASSRVAGCGQPLLAGKHIGILEAAKDAESHLDEMITGKKVGHADFSSISYNTICPECLDVLLALSGVRDLW